MLRIDCIVQYPVGILGRKAGKRFLLKFKAKEWMAFQSRPTCSGSIFSERVICACMANYRVYDNVL